MQKYKSLVLPLALLLGYFFRQLCAVLACAVPYVIFGILALTFSGVKLASLRQAELDLMIAIFESFVNLGV